MSGSVEVVVSGAVVEVVDDDEVVVVSPPPVLSMATRPRYTTSAVPTAAITHHQRGSMPPLPVPAGEAPDWPSVLMTRLPFSRDHASHQMPSQPIGSAVG